MLAAVAAVLAAGCGPTSHPPVVFPDGGQAQGCERFSIEKRVPGSATHLDSCDDPTCGNGNPPTGGNHCGFTLSCAAFSTAQKRCQWVHNLEHGHLVLAYNCPAGCPDEVLQLNQLRGSIRKGSNGVVRALVTPDPALPTKFAAIVWGYAWTGDTLDAAAIACVAAHQDELAPEPQLACSP